MIITFILNIPIGLIVISYMQKHNIDYPPYAYTNPIGKFILFMLISFFTLPLSYFLYLFLKLILCLISYPFRYMKIRRLIKNGEYFNRGTAGKILGCYVCKYEKIEEEQQHNWDGCKCLHCGITRDVQHDYIIISSETDKEPIIYNADIAGYTVKNVCRRCGDTYTTTSDYPLGTGG